MDLSALRVAGLIALVAIAGCAPFERPPAPAGEPRAAEEKAVTAKAPESAVEMRKAEPAPPPPPAADSPAASAGAASVPDAKATAELAPKKETAAPGPAKPPAAPPLDLNALEKRLKDTEAIGVFTKLTLKNQVDDLLVRFEAHHGGANRTSLAELRQPYDLLIIKVLSLLQDRDARLASDLLRSREAIWNILSDPARFQRLVKENRS